MIEHLSPRCIAVISGLATAHGRAALDLDTVLSADLCFTAAGEANLVLRLTTGQITVVGQYTDATEAWQDHAKLCLLAGIDRNGPGRLPSARVLARSSAQPSVPKPN